MDFHFQLDLRNEDAEVESSLPSRWHNIISKIVIPPIGIFWDLENVPIPRNKSPRHVVDNIRSKFLKNKWEAAFSVVCDVKKEKEEITNELNDSQVDIIHMRGTAKNAIDEKVKTLMRKFVRSHGAPSTLVLLAGDVNYANDLHEMRYQHGVQVVVIYPRSFSKSLLGCANLKFPYSDFTENLPDREVLTVDIIHMRGTAKNAIDEKVKTLMRKFVRSHGAPSTLVLLAGDVNYANDLHEMRYQHGVQVVVIYPRSFSKSLLGCANLKFPYSDFTENLPDREVLTMAKLVEVKVTSLPEGETLKVKRKLDILASNTGGKTKTIEGSEAVLKFANSYLAERAVRRMDKEKLHGNVIRAKLSSNAEDINQPSTSQATMGLSDESVDEAEGPEEDIHMMHQGGHGYNLRTNKKANIAKTEEEPPTASFLKNVLPHLKRKMDSSGAQKKKKKKGFQKKTRKSRPKTQNQ